MNRTSEVSKVSDFPIKRTNGSPVSRKVVHEVTDSARHAKESTYATAPELNEGFHEYAVFCQYSAER